MRLNRDEVAQALRETWEAVASSSDLSPSPGDWLDRMVALEDFWTEGPWSSER